ncbi:tetratricopeptide repeat protein [Candidatus Uhrbacteria bacterium]|nr:tetratricopeptide repeat protein [Candidatus Uhrbacteria bacterium]
MKLSPHAVLSFTVQGSLLALVFFLPVLFVPWSLDPLELNKQSLLLLLVSVAALAWCARAFETRTITLRRGLAVLLPVVFFALVLLSALFSPAGYQSFVGSALQQYQSVLTAGALTVFFWLVVQEASIAVFRRQTFFALLLSAALVLLSALAHTFGWALLPGQGNTFNPIGTLNALGLFGVVCSVFGLALWLASSKGDHDVFFSGLFGRMEKVLVVVICVVSLLYLLALDFWALWVALLVGVGTLFVMGLIRAEEFPHTRRFLLPTLMGVLAIFFLFLARPFSLGLPVEVTPTWTSSWNIARQTLQDGKFFFGTGPGTYAYDYERFRPSDINQTSFWNTRFDRAHNFILTMLPTLGVVPTLVFLLWVAGMAGLFLHGLLRDRGHALWHTHMAIGSAWLTLAVSLFLYSENLTLLFLFYLFSALLCADRLRERSWALSRSPRAGLLLSLAGVLLAIGFLTLMFVTGERHVGEVAFAKAIRADRAGESIDRVLDPLVRAATFNRHDDAVYRSLSEALLEKARQMLAGKAIADFASAELTALQNTIGGGVNAAKRATDVNPYNAVNWRVRGSVYREAMPLLSDAGEFARLSFERAAGLEPQNPVNVVGLGRVYLVEAGLLNRTLSASSGDERRGAEQKRQKALAMAEEAFGKAIGLKRDYAPAHFYLALAYQEEGRLEEAAQKLDELLRVHALDVGVAFQRGVLALRMNDFATAEKAFGRAVAVAPTFANARWFLASVFEAQGKTSEAIKQLEAMETTTSDAAIVAARIARLKEGMDTPEPIVPLEETVAETTVP